MEPIADRRIFRSWDRPFLAQAVDWLIEAAATEAPEGRAASAALNLSGFVAVVPTAQAGRRLREALALRASDANRAVFPPTVVEPQGLLRLLSPSDAEPAASRLEALAAWAGVLVEMSLDDFKAVFPVDPPARTFAWGLRIGQQLSALQAELAETGLRCADVARKAEAEAGFPERERWMELAKLERRFDQRLANLGRVDPQVAKIRAALRPQAPAGLTRIVVLGLPDPLPLALAALDSLSGQPNAPRVQCVISAPDSEKEHFDDWGRPRTDAWRTRSIAWPDFFGQVHLLADPFAVAQSVGELAVGYGESRDRLAIGCADPALAPALEQELSARGLPVFNPQGRKRREESFYHLLGCLADFARQPTFAAVEATGRCTEILAYLGRRLGASFAADAWMAGLDELHARHLPADLSAALRHAPSLAGFPLLAAGLERMDDLRRRARRGAFAEGVASVLQEIFAQRAVDPASADDQRLADSAAAWMDLLRGCQAQAPDGGLSADDGWDLALRLFGEERQVDEKPAGAIELQGWMEMLWEDAPHLVLAGLNEGRVPTAISGDPFLPESLRARLGLKTNADRLARDAYLLQAFLCAREKGRVDVLVAKGSARGDPLQPSRLLLACPPSGLPARVGHLFRTLPPAAAPAVWTRAWRLEPPPPPAELPAQLGVTTLKHWLACPFRFYLRCGLGMEALDTGKGEWDASDFGTLCHAALEGLGEEPRLRECSDPELLADFLLGRLEEKVRARYGAELALPLVIQVESARQRLRHAARIHAQLVWAGWRIEAVERRIELSLAGQALVARIDRIDRHRETGAVRLLDYKTSDAAVAPEDAHLRSPRLGEALAAFAQWNGGAKPKLWQDLQLPLYRHALAAEFPAIEACGYINLPKAVSHSALALWPDYTSALQESALACAEGVCTAIRRHEFWPPNPLIKPASDDYAPLFPHGAEDSVHWGARL